LSRFSTLLLFFFITANAQTIEDVAKKAHLANINALLIFTSQDGLNSGLFHFTKVGVDMEVYNLPFKYQFASSSNLNYFLVGNVGYSRVYISEDIVIPPSGNLNYDNHLRTYTAGLGGGVRYKLRQDLYCMGGLELIYSRSGTSVKEPDDGTGEAIEDFFNKNYNNNISYKVFAEAEYKPKFELLHPYAILSYKIYDTKSTFALSEFSTFKSQSSVLASSFGAESNKLLGNDNSYVTLEAYCHFNYLEGAVVESTKLNKYVKVGAVSYWYTDAFSSYIKRFFLEASSIHADGLQGYNIGVGFTLK